MTVPYSDSVVPSDPPDGITHLHRRRMRRSWLPRNEYSDAPRWRRGLCLLGQAVIRGEPLAEGCGCGAFTALGSFRDPGLHVVGW